jgi:hypothetical protein
VDTVTVAKPANLTVGSQSITGSESDPTQTIFLDWHESTSQPALSATDWVQATVDSTGHFSAMLTINNPGTQSTMYYRIGSGPTQTAWSATPTAPKVANIVTVVKPTKLIAGVQAITGTETDPTQPIFLDWHGSCCAPPLSAGDWVQATVDASGHFSAMINVDHPGTQSTMYYRIGTGPTIKAWSATPSS